jgi:probable HAF family extracellular repeat protein
MNALGQVVGEAVTKSGMAHAFRTAPGRPIDPTTDDLGTLAGPGGDAAGRGMSRARAVNDLGQVAGVASLRAGSYQHAFRTAPNRPIDAATDDLGTLGGLNSEAYGINNRGEVVGQSDIPPDPRRTPTHAFIYTETRMIDLNSLVELEPGWVLVRAFDINDRGQIAAAARIDSADSGPAAQRAYLLTPAPAIAPLAMLVLGSAVTASGMAVSRRRRAVDRARAQS